MGAYILKIVLPNGSDTSIGEIKLGCWDLQAS